MLKTTIRIASDPFRELVKERLLVGQFAFVACATSTDYKPQIIGLRYIYGIPYQGSNNPSSDISIVYSAKDVSETFDSA